jgi:septin family protein
MLIMNRLKTLDIEIMKRLHLRVNLIPVIAKSDTMTEEEIKAFKRRVRLSPVELCFALNMSLDYQ